MKNELRDVLTSFIRELSNTTSVTECCLCFVVTGYDLSTNRSAVTGGDGNKMVRGRVGMGLKSCPRADLYCWALHVTVKL